MLCARMAGLLLHLTVPNNWSFEFLLAVRLTELIICSNIWSIYSCIWGALHPVCHPSTQIQGEMACIRMYWHVLGTYLCVQVRIGMYWYVRMYWYVLIRLGTYWHVFACIFMYLHVLVCIGYVLVRIGAYWYVLICWYVLVCIDSPSYVLACIRMCWYVLAYSGMYWRVFGMYWHVSSCVGTYLRVLVCIHNLWFMPGSFNHRKEWLLHPAKARTNFRL